MTVPRHSLPSLSIAQLESLLTEREGLSRSSYAAPVCVGKFAGCTGFLAMFSFALKLVINIEFNFAN